MKQQHKTSLNDIFQSQKRNLLILSFYNAQRFSDKAIYVMEQLPSKLCMLSICKIHHIQMSRLEFQEMPEHEAIQVETFQENADEEGVIEDALSYMMQPQLMLKVKGFDQLVATKQYSVFEDLELSQKIFDEVKYILETTDSPNLISSVCFNLETVAPTLSHQTIGRYAYVLFVALYNSLKLAHQIGYPEALCQNILQLLHTAQLYISRIFECTEMAFQLLEQLETLSHIFSNLIQLSISIFGQYSQEFIEAINTDSFTEQPQFSRHITLLIQYYVTASQLFPALLHFPFLNLYLIQKFSSNIITCFQISGQLSTQQPLKQFLSELLSSQSIVEEVMSSNHSKQSIQQYFYNIIVADQHGLINNVLLSEKLAVFILNVMIENKMAQAESSYKDLLITCLGVIDIKSTKRRAVVKSNNVQPYYGEEDDNDDVSAERDSLASARKESQGILDLLNDRNLLFDLLSHIAQQYQEKVEIKQQPLINLMKLAYDQFIEQFNRLPINIQGLNISQSLIDYFINRNQSAPKPSFTAKTPDTIGERAQLEKLKAEKQHVIIDFTNSQLNKLIVQKMLSTCHLFSAMIIKYNHNKDVVIYLLQTILKQCLTLSQQNKLVLSDYKVHFIVNFILCCNNDRYMTLFVENIVLNRLVGKYKQLYQHKRACGRYTDGDTLLYAFVQQYPKIKSEVLQVNRDDMAVVDEKVLLNYYIDEFAEPCEDVPFLLLNNAIIKEACFAGKQQLDWALGIQYL